MTHKPRPLNLSFLRNALAAIVFLFTTAALADPVNWTGGAGDGNWNTEGNWSTGVVPGSGDIVVFGNSAPDEFQTITLTSNVEVQSIRMEATGNLRDYALVSEQDNGTDLYSLVVNSSSPLRQESTTTRDFTLGVATRLSSTDHPSLNFLSDTGARFIVDAPLVSRDNANSLRNPRIFGNDTESSGVFELRAQFQADRFLPSGEPNILLNYDGPGAVLIGTLRTLTSGRVANFFVEQDSSIPSGPAMDGGIHNWRLFNTGSDDRVVTLGTSDGGGEINLLAPLDSSSGTLTLSFGRLRGDGSRIAPLINTVAGTFVDLRGDQEVNRVDRSMGIHGTGGFTKTNGGVSNIWDKNSYTGGTYIIDGTVRLREQMIPEDAGGGDVLFSGEIGSGQLYVSSNGTFDMFGINQTVAGVNGYTDNAENTTYGTVALGGATLTINSTESSSFGGQFTGGGAVVKTGAETFIVTGTNAFDGTTTVEQGTLLVNGNLSASDITVESAARLGGTGTIGGDVLLTGGAILAPGNSPGTLTFAGDLIFESNATVNFDIGSGGSDLIVLNGNNQILSSESNLLWDFSANGEVLLNTSYQLIDWSDATGLDAIDFLLAHQVIANSGWDGDFAFGSDGLYVTFAAIPEPGHAAALIGLISLVLIIRIKSRKG